MIRQLARRAEEGTPFHRMAVLYGARSPYATLVREELQLAQIPVSGPNSVPLSRSAAGRTLNGLLDLCGSEFKRHEVMSWVTCCPVRLPGGRTTAASAPAIGTPSPERPESSAEFPSGPCAWTATPRRSGDPATS